MGNYDEAFIEIEESVGSLALRYSLSNADVRQILKDLMANYQEECKP
jgi:hypothetical protein